MERHAPSISRLKSPGTPKMVLTPSWVSLHEVEEREREGGEGRGGKEGWRRWSDRDENRMGEASLMVEMAKSMERDYLPSKDVVLEIEGRAKEETEGREEVQRWVGRSGGGEPADDSKIERRDGWGREKIEGELTVMVISPENLVVMLVKSWVDGLVEGWCGWWVVVRSKNRSSPRPFCLVFRRGRIRSRSRGKRHPYRFLEG